MPLCDPTMWRDGALHHIRIVLENQHTSYQSAPASADRRKEREEVISSCIWLCTFNFYGKLWIYHCLKAGTESGNKNQYSIIIICNMLNWLLWALLTHFSSPTHELAFLNKVLYEHTFVCLHTFVHACACVHAAIDNFFFSARESIIQECWRWCYIKVDWLWFCKWGCQRSETEDSLLHSILCR